MVSKHCPECKQQVPVACKACPCGHVFMSKNKLSKNDGSESGENSEVKRRRTERTNRERPDYFNCLQIEKQHLIQRKARHKSNHSGGEEGGSNGEDLPPQKKRVKTFPNVISALPGSSFYLTAEVNVQTKDTKETAFFEEIVDYILQIGTVNYLQGDYEQVVYYDLETREMFGINSSGIGCTTSKLENTKKNIFPNTNLKQWYYNDEKNVYLGPFSVIQNAFKSKKEGVGGMRSAVLGCPIHAQWDLGLGIELANSSEQLHGFGEKCRPHQPYVDGHYHPLEEGFLPFPMLEASHMLPRSRPDTSV
ncbi:C16orf87 [Cordylochernes scorpioides]|uniref:C16orf87 n=1 Tax=Cordylochernes scorpioides TaxID=51811 RepID=A0ABY6L9T1_9ARAC|nr:C16orf87 [Cordylochernes scorpioides]